MKERFIIQGMQHPSATSLFFIDKGIPTHTTIFPFHLLCLHFFCFYISFSCLLSPSLMLSFPLTRSDEEDVDSSASLGRQRQRQIHNGRLCMFVCLSGTHPSGLFKPLLERHGVRGVNGKLKQMCLCCA